jgi:hypothetical protein
MERGSSLDTLLTSSSKILFGSLLVTGLIGGISPIRAQEYQRNTEKYISESLETTCPVIQEKDVIDPWDYYCDSTIREYMNVPLYCSYDELIPLTDEEGQTVAYFRIYAGFRNPEEQNMDIFLGFVGSGYSSKGNLKKLSMGVTRAVVVYNEGVHPEQEEEWCKEQTCFGQRIRDDSLQKSNLKGDYQRNLIKIGVDFEKKLLSSSSELLHIAKSALDLPLEGINFVTKNELPGKLETDYGAQYKEPITAEDIYIYPQLGLLDSYGVKARNIRVGYKSTKKRRPLKLYLQVKLQRTWIHEGLLKYLDFGLGEPIIRTLDIPPRSEEE